jgi:type IX secretion system PorP/SprF family membrane protein
MMKRKLIRSDQIHWGILLLALLLKMTTGYSQQEALYSQYMFNGLVINPAYAGSSEVLSMTVSARKQWVGVEGAPSTETFSLHTPLKKEKIALGMTLINDNIGVTHQFGINAIYAFRIAVGENKKLSFGLQAGATQFTSQYTLLTTRMPGDATFAADQVSGVIPSFGGGIYYSAPKFYFGFSVPHLVNNIFKDTLVATNIFQRRNYMLTSGYVFTLSPNLKLKPSFLLKAAQGIPLQLDLNANFLIKEVLWLGCSVRNFNMLELLAQVQLTDQLKLGYSYDCAAGKTNTINKGSHELILNYNFSFVKNKIVTPRYF